MEIPHIRIPNPMVHARLKGRITKRWRYVNGKAVEVPVRNPHVAEKTPEKNP